MTIPEMWKVIEVTKPDGESFRKVFGGWRGGYLNGDSWRLNSGISQEEFKDNFYFFHGYSGSVYKCHKDAEGVYGTWLRGVFEDIIKTYKDKGYKVEVIDYNKEEEK